MGTIKSINVNGKNYLLSGEEASLIINDDSQSNLNIGDANGNVLVQFREGHIKTKNFDSSNININESPKTSKKSLKALFIGNSVSQDHIAYLPYILKNTYGDEIDFSIYIYYIGGYTIGQYVDNVITENKNAEIFSYAKNIEVWTNSSGTKLKDALQKEEWDIISIQGYFNNYRIEEDMTKVPVFVEFLKSNTKKSFELAWLMHQTYKSNEVLHDIIYGAKQAIIENPITLLFSPCFVTEYAKQFFSQSQLSPDGIHNHEGLPCMMGAFNVLSVILRWMGIPNKTIGNPLRMTIEKQSSLNIPGVNGTVDESFTDEDYYKCQCAAVKSMNAGDGLFNVSKNEMFVSLTPIINA